MNIENSNSVGSNFVTGLFLDGRIELQTNRPLEMGEVAAAVGTVMELEGVYRKSLPGSPPELDTQAIAWSLQKTYAAAQRLVFPGKNDFPSGELSRSAPFDATPETSFSVDLFFRFLPELMRLAQATRSERLQQELLEYGRAWPLSSVGMLNVLPESSLSDPAASQVSLEGFIHHPSLRMLYLDRIMKTRDLSRFNDKRVRESAAAAYGLHFELAPAVSRFLDEQKDLTA